MSSAASSLRSMVPADVDNVANLHATSWRSAYRGMLTNDFLDHHVLANRQAVWQERLRGPATAPAFGFVAENAAGELIGFTYVLLHHDPVWGTLVDNLHVHPEHKGGGIGRGLLRAVATQLGPEHTQPCFLWVLDANDPAKRFYARMGAEFAEQSMAPPFGGVALPEWRCVWRQPTSLLQRP